MQPLLKKNDLQRPHWFLYYTWKEGELHSVVFFHPPVMMSHRKCIVCLWKYNYFSQQCFPFEYCLALAEEACDCIFFQQLQLRAVEGIVRSRAKDCLTCWLLDFRSRQRHLFFKWILLFPFPFPKGDTYSTDKVSNIKCEKTASQLFLNLPWR